MKFLNIKLLITLLIGVLIGATTHFIIPTPNPIIQQQTIIKDSLIYVMLNEPENFNPETSNPNLHKIDTVMVETGEKHDTIIIGDVVKPTEESYVYHYSDSLLFEKEKVGMTYDLDVVFPKGTARFSPKIWNLQQPTIIQSTPTTAKKRGLKIDLQLLATSDLYNYSYGGANVVLNNFLVLGVHRSFIDKKTLFQGGLVLHLKK